MPGKRILPHGTHAEEPSRDCQTNSVTMSPLTFGHPTPSTATLLIITCRVQLNGRPTKLLVTPKMN